MHDIQHEIQPFLEWFDRYVGDFEEGTFQDRENILLKKRHSLRVLEEATRIADGIGLDREQRTLALLTALLHDVGRFPQYKRYRTFRDDESVDHARLGYERLKDEGVLTTLGPGRERTVLVGVLLHNRLRLSSKLQGHIRTVCQVVRDADKLDILDVLVPYLAPGGPENRVITMALDPDPKHYSQKLVDAVLSGSMGDYREMVWLNDFKLLLLSWVYDFNFPPTRKRFLEQGFLDRLFSFLPEMPEKTPLRERIMHHLSNGDS
ncbi:MAG: HD domain-containing protein [Desulfovibrionales bacterium]